METIILTAEIMCNLANEWFIEITHNGGPIEIRIITETRASKDEVIDDLIVHQRALKVWAAELEYEIEWKKTNGKK